MQRTIKSFVLRAGRVSKRQEHAFLHLLPHYALRCENKPYDFSAIFSRTADTIVEIGFGMGASLLAMAQREPERNFIGIEVHRAGLGSLAADLYEHAVNNVRLIQHDAVELFKSSFSANSLAGIQIFFPDPWPKKRHHKRRLIQTDFVKLLVNCIKPGGFIHCATDWQDYAEQMFAVLSAEPLLERANNQDRFVPRPETRPLTKFEQRGKNLGHGVWDLIFLKVTI